MAKQKFDGLNDSDIFSSECKHTFSMPRKAGGKYKVTIPGAHPDTLTDTVKAVDTLISVAVKLADIGQLTKRGTTEKDVEGGKLVVAVRHYGGASDAASSTPPVKQKRNRKAPNRGVVTEAAGS